MSSAAQIQANQQNAQHSTGPKTEQGKKQSSLNATTHGYTGQTVVISAEEKDAYETHCIAYLEQYQPKTHEEASLIHQYADHQWTLHQISVQQINVMSMLNAATTHHMRTGSDFETLNAAVAPFYKQISTLGTYEQRRRRASEATLTQFRELAEARQAALAAAVEIYKFLKSEGKPFNPAEFGFVHSAAEIETAVAVETARASALKKKIAGANA